VPLPRTGRAADDVLARLEALQADDVDWHAGRAFSHKYGYTPKGASVLVHSTRALRKHQTFTTDNWLGGLYGSSGILGTGAEAQSPAPGR
jgi:hypothetical protein